MRTYLLVPPPAAGLLLDTDAELANINVQMAFSGLPSPNKNELLDLARARYLRALGQNPAHQGALLGLARMAVRLDDRDRAAAAFERYLTIYPADADTHHEAGLAYGRFGDWAGAAEHCAAAARLDPENRQYAAHLGFCLARAGRWDEAERALARVMPEAQARANLNAVREHVPRLTPDVPKPIAVVIPDAPKPPPVLIPVAPVVAVVPPPDAPVPTVAPAPRAVPTLTAAYRLRNVAANDTAITLAQCLSGCGREVGITPVAKANELVVHGSAATHARVAALVADLDREPTQIDISTTMVQVPAGFLRECGLARPGAADAVWTLTEREAALFSVALRHHPKLTVLSRPQIRVADGQTGFVQVGQDVPVSRVESTGALARVGYVPAGVTARLSPRLAPSGKAMLLRVEAQLCSPAASPARVERGAAFPFDVQTVQTTVAVPTGHTVVLSVPTTGADGKPTAVLYVMTPTVRQP